MRPALLIPVTILTALGCSISTTGGTDGSAPQVAITHPADGDTVSGQVSIDVTAVDDYGVDKVRFLIDGTELAVQYTPPFHVNWNTSSLTDLSTHTIQAAASDVAGNTRFTLIHVVVRKGQPQ